MTNTDAPLVFQRAVALGGQRHATLMLGALLSHISHTVSAETLQ
jgi:hypothetical protein